MHEIETSKIREILLNLSKKYILPKYKNLKDQDIKYKNNSDVYTSVDIIVEKELNTILCKLLPGSLFVGEEKFFEYPDIINNYNLNQYCWTVDPLDGTKNFVKGKDKFAIMIALTFGDKILQSWIYNPLTEDIFYAIKYKGSFHNDKKIKIERSSNLSDSVGSISTKYWEEDYLTRMKKIKNLFFKINSYGCIGFEYIHIATNNRDFAILSKLSPWDHLSGILLIREAGGFDSYFDNGIYNHCLPKKNLVVASNTKIGNKILSIIKE